MATKSAAKDVLVHVPTTDFIIVGITQKIKWKFYNNLFSSKYIKHPFIF